MTQIKRLNIEKDKRVLITSDIHGNLELFQSMLTKVGYSNKDILIINGDISEKGTDSIGLFLYLIDLQKEGEVYFTLGNCDHLINHFHDDEKITGMTEYMNSRANTILAEFGCQMGGEMDYIKRRQYAIETYPEIIELVASMPLIIETDDFICVHAGLREDGKVDFRYNTSFPNFIKENVKFDKPVIVGHYPVCLSRNDEICHNVFYDREKNIIASDGGNMIKPLGQLNLVIYQDGDFTFEAFDLLETIAAPHDQVGQKGVAINWDNNGISILEKGEEMSLIHHPFSGEDFYVHNYFLDLERGKSIRDTTNALVDVKAGDPITILLDTEKSYYIKCNGYEGWYNKKS